MKNKDRIINGIQIGAIFGVALLILSLIVALIAVPISMSFNDHDYTVLVTGKERVVEGRSSKYLIYCRTDDNDVLVLENTDNMYRGKWNSSDIYGEIESGKTYHFNVVGCRIPFLSWYENILTIKSIE